MEKKKGGAPTFWARRTDNGLTRSQTGREGEGNLQDAAVATSPGIPPQSTPTQHTHYPSHAYGPQQQQRWHPPQARFRSAQGIAKPQYLHAANGDHRIQECTAPSSPHPRTCFPFSSEQKSRSPSLFDFLSISHHG
jgi:hypothetical protein